MRRVKVVSRAHVRFPLIQAVPQGTAATLLLRWKYGSELRARNLTTASIFVVRRPTVPLDHTELGAK